MDHAPVGKKLFAISLILSLALLIATTIPHILHQRTTIVFCNVGQGDGAYIRVENRMDIVIDAGPDKSILTCLGRYMPFFDRTIELAINTHPQKDHYYGFLYLIDRYRVQNLFLNPVQSTNQSFQQLLLKAKQKKVNLSFPTAPTQLKIRSARLYFFWPPQTITQTQLKDSNDASFIVTFEQNAVKTLFTGDAPQSVLQTLLGKSELKSDILKIPHHGSKNGLTREFFALADPTLSVISVGKRNSYGHPAKEILEMFEASKRKYFRTDRDGDVIITMERSKIHIKTQNGAERRNGEKAPKFKHSEECCGFP
ncbi:hypothetical protein HY358_01835 [Candidatus Roizmanbacteria bacterium]|nr:hypothetical protein [Candidatus Roizmanbacteria bacterium]